MIATFFQPRYQDFFPFLNFFPSPNLKKGKSPGKEVDIFPGLSVLLFYLFIYLFVHNTLTLHYKAQKDV